MPARPCGGRSRVRLFADTGCRDRDNDGLVRTTLAFLARHRWAGVGLALVAEILLLVALGLAPASATIGMPAAVAAAIAGTVAVVFGVVDGVVVAGAGAAAFAALGGWGAGEIAAIGVWPAIVAAVGLFAGRVDRHRAAFRQFVEAQEEERRSLALTLHDSRTRRPPIAIPTRSEASRASSASILSAATRSGTAPDTRSLQVPRTSR